MVDKKKIYEYGLSFFEKNKGREEKELLRLVKKSVSSKPVKFLEVGVGTGRFLERVHKTFPAFSCFGTDVVPDFVKKAPKGVTLSLQSAEKMSFPDRFFDCVTCIDVIHHVPNRQKALAEIGRVAKPGATVIFRDIRPKHAFDKLYYRLVDLSCFAYNSNMPKYFSPLDWEKHLKKSGLSIREIKPFDSQLDWIVCQKV